MQETWAFQLVVLFAGHLGDQEIAVMVYAATLTLFLNAFVQGIGLATNLRVAHLLGAGDPSAARHSARVTLIITAFLGLAGGCVIYFGRDGIEWVMTADEGLRDMFDDI